MILVLRQLRIQRIGEFHFQLIFVMLFEDLIQIIHKNAVHISLNCEEL